MVGNAQPPGVNGPANAEPPAFQADKNGAEVIEWSPRRPYEGMVLRFQGLER